MQITKIISGGQTGADRAALDAALACGIPHGGWCPKGRLAEDGPIPPQYNLREMETESYSERTRANVADSDLTLIFSHGPLIGGSLLTQQFAEELGKPCVHIDLNIADATSLSRSTHAEKRDEDIASTFGKNSNIVLNVAGPRASGDSQIYDAVYEQVMRLLS
jgi:predicted Rossmann fold nucleotide-binding protein DprA/Smf involved in DNA uptake